jgi:hypothetical protein
VSPYVVVGRKLTPGIVARFMSVVTVTFFYHQKQNFPTVFASYYTCILIMYCRFNLLYNFLSTASSGLMNKLMNFKHSLPVRCRVTETV